MGPIEQAKQYIRDEIERLQSALTALDALTVPDRGRSDQFLPDFLAHMGEAAAAPNGRPQEPHQAPEKEPEQVPLPDPKPRAQYRDDDLLNAREAGELIGYTGASMRRIAKDGRIPHIRLSPRRIRFRKADVVAFSESHQKNYRY